MSTRPPSALASGTASRLTSAMHSNSGAQNQRIGTAIGFTDNVHLVLEFEIFPHMKSILIFHMISILIHFSEAI